MEAVFEAVQGRVALGIGGLQGHGEGDRHARERCVDTGLEHETHTITPTIT